MLDNGYSYIEGTLVKQAVNGGQSYKYVITNGKITEQDTDSIYASVDEAINNLNQSNDNSINCYIKTKVTDIKYNWKNQ
jgi:hypothetical protein